MNKGELFTVGSSIGTRNRILFIHIDGCKRLYRNDFKNAVESILPQFLFTHATPKVIRERLQKEFLQNDSTLAINAIAPLYRMDIRNIAGSLGLPVRSINCSYSSTNRENSERYFHDYD